MRSTVWPAFAYEYEHDFVKAMLGRSAKVAENDRTRKQRELNALLTRDKELDMLFERLYEDNVAGKIDDARFAKMSKRYEQEQGEERRENQSPAAGTKKGRGAADGYGGLSANGAAVHPRYKNHPAYGVRAD